MKKGLLASIFLILINFAFSQQPKVCVIGPGGNICSSSNLDPVNPCSLIPFILDDYLPVPSGYAIVGKFEWFVNGVSVKSTTDPTDYGLNWVVVSKPLDVLCKVTYKKDDGTLSSPFTSTTFIPTIKDLNFSNISMSSIAPNYGCTNNLVAFSLNTFVCSGSICDYVYNVVGPYNITWQPPSGWTQNSISTNGNEVSFIPDAMSSGPLTATIHLPCGYTETRTFNTTRIAQAPDFTVPIVTSCTSSASVSINGTCGASDYTYTIEGNPGVTFAANGQQILTTSSTTVSVSLSGSGSVNTLKAKANYPGSISSSDVSSSLIAGKPKPGPIGFPLIDPAMGKIQAWIDPPVPGATYYNWYKDNIYINVPVNNGSLIQFPIPRNVCDVDYYISVEAINACGTSQRSNAVAHVPCDYYYLISPNPVTNNVTVSTDPAKSAGKNSTFEEIRIYDQQGNLKKQQKFGKVKSGVVNTATLPNGNYFVEIINGDYHERKQILIQK